MKKRTIILESILLCVILLLTLITISIGINTNIHVSCPAFVFNRNDGNWQATNINVQGTWNKNGFNYNKDRFTGTIFVNCLPYTMYSDNWEIETTFITDPAWNYYLGGFFYNTDAIAHAHAQLRIDYSGENILLITNELYSNTDAYVIVAPATTQEEALLILESIGKDLIP